MCVLGHTIKKCTFIYFFPSQDTEGRLGIILTVLKILLFHLVPMARDFVLTIVGYRRIDIDGEYLIACEIERYFFNQCQILLLQCTA